jgi:hypothetical protein
MQVAWKNVFTKTTVAIHPRQHVELARELHIKVVRKLYDHGRRKPCNKAKRVLVGGHPWDIWTRILFVSFLLVPIVCVYIFHDYCREAMIKHLNEPRFEPFSIWSRVIDLHLNTHSSHEICLDIYFQWLWAAVCVPTFSRARLAFCALTTLSRSIQYHLPVPRENEQGNVYTDVSKVY